MENLEGGWDKMCAFALGFGLVTCVASGGWSIVAASMACSTNAY
jgi:hypothetical protein